MAKKTITTPIGVAVYPRVERADTKFDKAGVYSVKLRLSSAEGGPIIKMIEHGIDTAVASAKEKNPGKKVKRADAPYSVDDDSGDYLINFKLKASGKTKEGKEFTQKVSVFDAKGKPFLNSKIGGGSRIRVGFEMGEFYTALIGAGVTLRLRAVQVIDYTEYNGGDAKSYGFGEEDGFESAPAAEAVVETGTTDDSSKDEGDGDDF